MAAFFDILADIVMHYAFEPLDDETIRRVNYDMQEYAPGPYAIVLNESHTFELQFIIDEDSDEVLLWKLKWL